MARLQDVSPPVIAKAGSYTIFITPTTKLKPQRPQSISSRRDIENATLLEEKGAAAQLYKSPPPPVQVPPPQFAASPSKFGLLWNAFAKVQDAHTNLDRFLAEWFGLNQSKYQWALNDFLERDGTDPPWASMDEWKDVICPICLDFPHNGVLVKCSSSENGCRPFICDTGKSQSNCLDRFWSASGPDSKPICPLCRGEVTGWVIVDKARTCLNAMQRCCEEHRCSFVGDYLSLKEHSLKFHPHSRPSEIDPARKIDWEQFQQSSEIVDVISTIHSEVPRGIVLGDYVIEYGDDDDGHDRMDGNHEYEDFPGDDGHWWTSCILYQVFDNFRASRNRRRARRVRRRGGMFDDSVADEGSSSSVDTIDFRMDETDDELTGSGVVAGNSRESSRRRRSRFHDR